MVSKGQVLRVNGLGPVDRTRRPGKRGGRRPKNRDDLF